MTERTQTLRGILSRTNSDERLFERAVRGDAIAFSEFYRRFHPRIYAFCLSRLMDSSLAEEAAQETFVRMLHSNVTSIESPKSWLYGVARNVTLEAGRQRAKADPVDDADDLFSEMAPDSGQELMRREQGRNIVLALRRMRPRYRTALVMRELHGLSSVEIAEALETTTGAVDTLVSRARDSFGKIYAEVSDLPAECAATFPLIYKERGTGLTDAERSRLESHLSTCERCRQETRFAEKPQAMSAVLPLLAVFGAEKQGLLGRLLASVNPALSSAPAASLPLATQGAAKVIVAVAVTATVAASGTGAAVHYAKTQSAEKAKGDAAIHRTASWRKDRSTGSPAAISVAGTDTAAIDASDTANASSTIDATHGPRPDMLVGSKQKPLPATAIAGKMKALANKAAALARHQKAKAKAKPASSAKSKAKPPAKPAKKDSSEQTQKQDSGSSRQGDGTSSSQRDNADN